MTTFDEAYFVEKKKNIERVLQQVLPSETTPPFLLHKAMRYSVMSPGKRIRPLLCLIACEAVGGDEFQTLLPAAAIELFHTYTLIHDDLPCMDDDDYRRGQLSCHTIFGDAIAILTGDALQALAFDLLAKAQDSAGLKKPVNYLKELTEIAGSCGVVGGQSLEIEIAGEKINLQTVERIHYGKTAALFKASARIGAMAGNANQNQIDSLTSYAVNLGIAFQFVDDLLDTPHEQKDSVSKIPCRKKRQEFNSVDVLGIDVVSERANYFTAQAESAIEEFQGEGKQCLIDFVHWLLKRKS